MLIKKVVLKNVCQHSELSVEFSRGVNGIFGPSASGKSNLINSIQGAWTGNFNVVSSKKDDNVKNDAPLNEKSNVYTSWEHNGLPFSIIRDMRSSASELRIKDKRIVKSVDIEEELEAIIGVKKEIVSEYVFVSQWNIFNFLTASTASRRKSFMNLCNLEHLFDMSAYLSKVQRNDMHLVAGVVDDENAVRARISQRNSRISELRESIKQHSTFVLNKDRREKFEQLLADNISKIELDKSVAERQQENKIAKMDLKTAEDSLATFIQQKNEVIRKVEALEKKLQNVRDYLDAAHSYNMYERYLKQRSDCTAPGEPGLKPDVKNLEENKARLAVLSSEYTKLKQKLEKYESGDLNLCTECGVTEINKNSDVYAAWAKTLSENLQEQHELKLKIKKDTAALEDWRRYVVAKNDYNKKRQELDAKIAECSVTKKPIGNYSDDDNNRIKIEISAQNSKLNSLSKQIQTTEIKVASLKSKIHSTDSEIQKELLKIENLMISTQDQLEKASKAIKRATAAEIKIAENKAVIKSLLEANDEDFIYVNKIEKAKKLSEKARDWVESLDRWADIVHPSKLPELVLKKAMIGLLEKTNEYLEKFNCEYRVVTDSGMDFLVKKPNGFVLPGIRLSGGEKVALGIAFRLAAISNLGLVVLDEPTAGLDEDRLDAVIDVLGELANVARDNDQQIILVTHDSRLDRVLDKKIVLRSA